MNRRILSFATMFALLCFVRAAVAADADAGAGETTYGCVESVPSGAKRPAVFDFFPARGTSGWAAALEVTVRHGKGERVLPSGLDLSSAAEAKKVLEEAGFTVPDQDGGAAARVFSDPEDPNKSEVTTHLELPLVLLPKNPGRTRMTLPPLPVAVARANGEIATVCTRPHEIVVEDPTSSTPNAMPKGNPDGMPQREEWTTLKHAVEWGALGLVLGAILAIAIWRWMKRPKAVPPPPPPRPPWEIALEELESLRHAGLLEAHRFTEHFNRTSDAVRRYLGARFGFDGIESTTDEIFIALKRQGVGFIRFDAPGTPENAFSPGPSIRFQDIAKFLRECDLVKFANLTPTPDQCATSISIGEGIVRGTMPNARPVYPAPAAEPVAVAVPAAEPTTRSPYAPPETHDAPPAAEPDVAPPRDGDDHGGAS